MSNQRKNQLLHRYAVVSSMKGIQNNNLLSARKQTTQARGNSIEAVILDQRKVDSKMDRVLFDKLGRELESKISEERDNLWKGRTNQPYKNIMPLSEFKKEFKKKDDLIVYKVNQCDKDKQALENKSKIFRQEIDKHNKELKEIYNDSKINEHKEEFEYNHIKKYNVKYDPTEFNDMKESAIDYYKKEQQKEEQDKKCIDDIIETMVETTNTSPDLDANNQRESIVISSDIPSSEKDDNESKNDAKQSISIDKYKQRQKMV